MRAWLAAALPRLWLQRRWPARLLRPLSLIYALLTALRRGLYRSGWMQSTRLPVPVIVVGNVVAGGSGKTPVVMAIVQHLRSRGLQVGVVSRGYGRSTRDCREVTATSPVDATGDEPALIKRACQVPVFVASRRADAASALLATYPAVQVIVCDDGLQHLALARDIEICVFDDRGTGNGWLLPAGPLRERWPRPADFTLHTGDHPAFAGWRATRRLADMAVQADGSQRSLRALGSQPVLAVAGIARPEAFFTMLREAGVATTLTLALPDHHDYSGWQAPADAPTTWVCTEKDAVKLWPAHPKAWAVPLRLELAPGLLSALEDLLAARVPSRPGDPPLPMNASHGQQTS